MKKKLPILILILALIAISLTACANKPTTGGNSYTDYIGGDKVFAVSAGEIFESFVQDEGWCDKPLLCNSVTNIAELVKSGRADAGMVSEDAVDALVQSGAYDMLTYLPVPTEVLAINSGPVFSNQALADEYGKFIVQIKNDGTLQEVTDRYLSGGGLPAYEDIPKTELTGKNGTLRAADTGNYPPMSYVGEGGEFFGYGIELAQRFAQFLGKKIEFSFMTYDAVLPSVVSGVNDMSSCFYAITEERSEGAIFSDPIMSLSSVLIVRKSDATEQKYTDYIGKRFSILTGSVFDTVADDVFSASSKQYYKNVTDEIIAVDLGKTDAALLDDVAATQALGSGQYPSLTSIPVEIDSLDFEYGVFSSKKDIIDKYNIFLAEITENGMLKEMQDRWLTSYSLDTELPDIPLTGTKGKLTVAAMKSYPPFAFSGDEDMWTGFDVEQLRRFAAWMDMDIEFVHVDFGALLSYVDSGKADLGASVYATEERKAAFHFSNPDYVSKTVLVVKDISNKARDHTWFKNKKVGVEIGAIFEPILKEFGAVPSLYQDVITAVEDVRNGRIAGCATDYITLKAIAAESGNEGFEVIPVPESLFAAPLAAITNLKNQALADEFNAFLAVIEKNGVLKQMQDLWLSDGADLTNITMPELEYSGAKGTLKIAFIGTYPPFDYIESGKSKGFCVELANRFASQAGYKVEYTITDPASFIAAIIGNVADIGITSLSVTDERKESVLFTDPFYQDQLAILALKQNSGGSNDNRVGFFAWLKNAIERNLIKEARWKMVLNGLGVTMLISILSQLLATVLGAGLTYILTRKNRIASGIGRFYSAFIHGLPIVVLLMISYYIIFGKTGVSSILIAVFAFGLVEAAGFAANMKGAIDTVDPTEIEAARSMGFSASRAFRAVTLPQAVKRAFSGYCNSFVELVKATAIVGYIAIQDLTMVGDIIMSRTYDAFFPLILVALIYLVVTTICVQLFKFIVRKINKEGR